jgi:GDPmannose 4,6-dehydratase
MKIHEYLTKDYDGKEVSQALAHFKPDVFVNLASLSSVALCEKNPELSRRINLELPSSILEMIARGQVGDCTFIQASSSEMYAGTSHQIVSELSKLNPKSIYGIHKAEVHQKLAQYRDSNVVRALGTILFNNESKLRDEKFASKRIIKDLVKIKFGLSDEFRLGSDFVLRDWNHPTDTAQAISLIITKGIVEDFVIGSGVLHSVRDLIEEAANLLQLDWTQINLIRDPDLVRPFENHGLVADPSKIIRTLGWRAKYRFKDIVNELVQNELIAHK